ncbi:MAG: hypothetical protein IT369_00035 [Candidatus Latescibacteria bacterium]|nr:hypothetical protein [Candidatus Latescibacterota bacterium]
MKKTLSFCLLFCLLVSAPEIHATLDLAVGPAQELPAWPLEFSDHAQPCKLGKRVLAEVAVPPGEFALPCQVPPDHQDQGFCPQGSRWQPPPLYTLLNAYRI